MEDHAVTVVRGANVSDEDHIRFSRAFGAPGSCRPGSTAPSARRYQRRMAPRLFDASNLDENGEIIPAYNSEKKLAGVQALPAPTARSMRCRPKWSLLLGHIVPQKAATPISSAPAQSMMRSRKRPGRVADLVAILHSGAAAS